nr:hypothetical protein [Microbacterium lacus]
MTIKILAPITNGAGEDCVIAMKSNTTLDTHAPIGMITAIG